MNASASDLFAKWSRLQEMKAAGKRIVSLALYTREEAVMAAPYLDFILVGDSVAMTYYGLGTTQAATLDMMIKHGKEVVAGAGDTPVVVDMPECAYRTVDDAVWAGQRIMRETGCAALKLEAGADKAHIVKALSDCKNYFIRHSPVIRKIPVMGHIGLMPSHYGEGDKYKIQGRGPDGALSQIADALAIQAAGAFSIVIEGVVEPVASHLASTLTVPTIGIGASPDCSGQILVLYDVLGRRTAALARPPKFARQFKEEGMTDAQAVAAYAAAVRDGSFPDRTLHCFAPKATEGKVTLYKPAP